MLLLLLVCLARSLGSWPDLLGGCTGRPGLNWSWARCVYHCQRPAGRPLGQAQAVIHLSAGHRLPPLKVSSSGIAPGRMRGQFNRTSGPHSHSRGIPFGPQGPRGSQKATIAGHRSVRPGRAGRPGTWPPASRDQASCRLVVSSELLSGSPSCRRRPGSISRPDRLR